MLERDRAEAFGEHITKLLFCVNLNKLDITRTNVFTEPVVFVFDSIMFRARSHTARLKFA
jgi:hypothetical protein